MAECVEGLSSPPDFSPCRLEAVVARCSKPCRILAEDKQITLRTEGLESLPEIQADEPADNAFTISINNAIPETPAAVPFSVLGRHQSGAINDTICLL